MPVLWIPHCVLKGKTNYKVTQDREDQQEVVVTKEYPDSVDLVKKARQVSL